MAMIVVALSKPEPIVRGVLRNALIEPRPNLFVGRLDSKRVAALIALLEAKACDAILICENRREAAGLSFKVFGTMPDREIARIDGLDLVLRKRSSESAR